MQAIKDNAVFAPASEMHRRDLVQGHTWIRPETSCNLCPYISCVTISEHHTETAGPQDDPVGF